MRMYPRYTVKDVLNEYAITFFTMLNEGYRLQNQHYLMMSQVISVPHMKDDARAGFMRQLEWAIKDPSDILKPDDDDSAGIKSVANLFKKV